MYIIAVAAFCFAYYFVNVANVPMAIKKGFKLPPGKRLKPFDCVQCLTVWMAIVLYILPISVSQFIAVAFGAGFIATKIK